MESQQNMYSKSEMYVHLMTNNKGFWNILKSVIFEVMPEFIRYWHYGDIAAKNVEKEIRKIKEVSHCYTFLNGKSLISSINFKSMNNGQFISYRLSYNDISFDKIKKLANSRFMYNPVDVKKHICCCQMAKKRYLNLCKLGKASLFKSIYFIPKAS